MFFLELGLYELYIVMFVVTLWFKFIYADLSSGMYLFPRLDSKSEVYLWLICVKCNELQRELSLFAFPEIGLKNMV